MTPKRADESAEEMPPRVWVHMHELPDDIMNDGEPKINAHAATAEQREYYRSKGYPDPAGEVPYVPESLLHAAKEQAKRDVAEALGKLDEHRAWLKGCNDAAFGNMEGADGKDFEYWDKWHGDTATEISKLDAAIATLREGK